MGEEDPHNWPADIEEALAAGILTGQVPVGESDDPEGSL